MRRPLDCSQPAMYDEMTYIHEKNGRSEERRTRPLAAVLQAAIDTLENKIIQSDGDLLSFAFFG